MTRKKAVSKQKTLPPMWLIGIAIGLVAVAGVFIALNQLSPAETSFARDVSIEDAAVLRNEGAFILDVRQPEEWEQVHIPGSTLIPLDQLPNRLSEVPADQDIVVVCRSGNRSQSGRDILLQAGWENVASMDGGVTAWQAKGLPTVSGP